MKNRWVAISVVIVLPTAATLWIALSSTGLEVRETECCIDSTLVSLELARSVETVSHLTLQLGNTVGLRTNLTADTWAFAPAYSLALLYLGALFIFRDGKTAWGYLAIGLVLLTFLADESENWHTLRTLAANSPDAVSWMRGSSLVKWAGAGLTALVLARLFVPQPHWRHQVKLLSAIAAGCFLFAGSLLTWGAFATTVWGNNDPAIETGFATELVAFVPVALLVAFYKHWRLPDDGLS